MNNDWLTYSFSMWEKLKTNKRRKINLFSCLRLYSLMWWSCIKAHHSCLLPSTELFIHSEYLTIFLSVTHIFFLLYSPLYSSIPISFVDLSSSALFIKQTISRFSFNRSKPMFTVHTTDPNKTQRDSQDKCTSASLCWVHTSSAGHQALHPCGPWWAGTLEILVATVLQWQFYQTRSTASIGHICNFTVI